MPEGTDATAVKELLATPVARAHRHAFFLREMPDVRRTLGACALGYVFLINAILLAGGMAWWRTVAVVGLLSAGLTIQAAWQDWFSSTPRRVELGFLVNSLSNQTLGAGVIALTGGLHGPTVMAFGLNMAINVLMCSGHRFLVYILGAQLLVIVVVGLLPESVTGPPITTWHFEAVFVVTAIWSMVAPFVIGTKLARASQDATVALDELRQEKVHEAETHTRRLQQVSARVAHELKNPLAAIKGLVQLVARKTEDAKASERLEVVQGEIERMGIILREYLSYARPLEELAPVPIDLADVARDMAAVVGGRAETARVGLALSARAAPLTADPRRIKEALLNVLSNAIEATPAGGTVAIETRPGPEGGAVIEVKDTGRGIKPDDLKRMGTSFFTTRNEGTGLGVVLVVGVVQQHGGRVRYTSLPGQGTTVTISLPPTPQALPPGTVVLSVEPRDAEPSP